VAVAVPQTRAQTAAITQARYGRRSRAGFESADMIFS